MFQGWIKDLPKPPLPPLEVTLERYLAGIEAVVPKNQFDETAKIVKEFASGDGVALHRLVEKLAEEKENWVSLLGKTPLDMCVFVCMYVRIHVRLYEFIKCVSIYAHLFIFIRMHACMYIYIFFRYCFFGCGLIEMFGTFCSFRA